MMPPASYKDFYNQLLGACAYDQEQWPTVRLEDWLWESFAFADHGAIYIRHMPGYNGADHNRQTYLQIKGGAVEVPKWLQ